MIQAATRELNDMRQMFKDNPDLTRQLGDVEREISRLAVGDISSAELQNRLNREVLPNLESLEVQLRRQVEQQNGVQVRSGSTDKVPAGYASGGGGVLPEIEQGQAISSETLDPARRTWLDLQRQRDRLRFCSLFHRFRHTLKPAHCTGFHGIPLVIDFRHAKESPLPPAA